jgi:N-acetylglucosamine kinase-like BadF-type ATPase
MVVALAEAGDSVAERVLLRAGVELAEQVEVVWKKMRRHGEWRGAVAYTGGVVEKVALVREGMRRRIEARCVGLRVMGGVVALEGALWRARGTVMHAGIGTRDEWG